MENKNPSDLKVLCGTVSGEVGILKNIMGHITKRFGKLDANHKEIVEALKKFGYSVGETSSAANFVDFVCACEKYTVLMEIKIDKPSAYFYLEQLKNIAEWKGYIAFPSSIEEAIKVMKFPELYCLNSREKKALFDYYVKKKMESKDRKPKVYVSAFEKEFMAVVRPERGK